MDKLMRYIILATIAGVILAFNMYHSDYKLLIAQSGTIALLAMLLMSTPGLAKGIFNIKNPLLIFFAVCILSFILSPHKLVSGQELYKVGTWIIFGIMLSAVIHQPSAKNLLREVINVWLICAGIVAIYGILQFFGIDFMKFRLQHGRIVANFGNPTLLAGFLAMTLPVAFARMFENRKTFSSRFPVVGLISVLFACLILTRSRAGIAVAMAGVFILLIWIRKIKLRTAMLIIAGILAIIFALSVMPSTRDIIFNTLMRKTLRFDIWNNAFQLIRVNPLMGTGIGTFPLYFPNFVTEGILKVHFVGVEFVNHAHSEYLEILSEMGILGLAAFLAVVVFALRRIKQDPGQAGLSAAFIVVLLNNIVGVDLRYASTGMFFWAIAGIFTLKDNRAISFQPPVSNCQRPVLNWAIIIAAAIVIYFTAKPYMEIQKVREQGFFSKNLSQINSKIGKMELSERKGADYFFNMGVLYAKKEDFKKATECFFAVVEKNPLHAGAYNNLGNINVVMGNIESAKVFFQKAAELEPNNVEYLINFASACFKLNKMEEGMAGLEKALAIDPNNSRALLLRRQMTQ